MESPRYDPEIESPRHDPSDLLHLEIPSKSSSTLVDDHDYANGGSPNYYSDEEHIEVYPSMTNLMDGVSPCHTTESGMSEMPFDERGSYEREKKKHKKQKQDDINDDDSNGSGERRSAKKPSAFSFSNKKKSSKKRFDENAAESVFRGTSKTKDNNSKTTRSPICPLWTWFTEDILHASIIRTVVWLSTTSARYPYTTIGALSLASIALLAIGFFTNFTLVLDTDQIFTPMNSLPMEHYEWLMEDSGFNNIRPLILILHAHGANVLGKHSLDKLFDAIDAVRETPGYDDLCQRGSYKSYDNIHTCRILSATRFWNHDRTKFEQNITNDEDAAMMLSRSLYPNSQTPVFHELILGNFEMSSSTTVYQANGESFVQQNITEHHPQVHFVQSLFVRFELPDVGADADEFEARALEALAELKQTWEDDNTAFLETGYAPQSEPSVSVSTNTSNGDADNNLPAQYLNLELDFLSIFAYKIENQRALIRDLPLVGGIILVLMIFTTLVFMKPHKVYSRSMLGCASLATIGISLMFSYGLVWCIGVPFTNIAQILPFMVMGVGLDDTFIITGAYFRTNPNDTIEQRITTTMREIGLSITLTSVTTMVAFLLGSFSHIPGVKWICGYAFSAIFFDYWFQITLFVAFLALDERRLQAYRRNYCCWQRVPVDLDECESQLGVIISSSYEEDLSDNDKHIIAVSTNDDLDQAVVSVRPRPPNNKGSAGSNKHFSERLMDWYGERLMRPLVKLVVLLTFTSYFCFCCYRTTLLTQEFNVEDYTPSDSYLRGTLESLESYYSLTKPIEVFFRDVDQADPSIQEQMRIYVEELAALPQIGSNSTFCWVHDFQKIDEQFPEYASLLGNLSFTQKLHFALADPTIREVYGEDIVIDEESGNISASRCLLFLRNVDLTVVKDQIDVLVGQREVTASQPINQNQALGDWPFFSFDKIFFYWELYAQAVNELMATIVSGVVAVAVVTYVLIPHWSAIFFVGPGIIILYIDFLGTMEWMGLHINSLTYVIIVMAIGLLVDFLVHILLRYYETEGSTREEKVKDALSTMGASMFVGGMTTFLGVCPLVLSTTHIFMTVFWAFLAIVVLGFTHGLILLPVVLSLIGPVATHREKSSDIHDLRKVKGTNSSTSPSGSPGNQSHQSEYDDENLIIQSSSSEEAEDVPAEAAKKIPKKRAVPFLGPSFDLEAIEEGPDSARSSRAGSVRSTRSNRPDSTRNQPESTKSRRSIAPAPSDERNAESPRQVAIINKGNALSSLLGELVGNAYDCGAVEFDLFNNSVGNCQKSCKK